jgi:hypothetical protein
MLLTFLHFKHWYLPSLLQIAQMWWVCDRRLIFNEDKIILPVNIVMKKLNCVWNLMRITPHSTMNGKELKFLTNYGIF